MRCGPAPTAPRRRRWSAAAGLRSPARWGGACWSRRHQVDEQPDLDQEGRLEQDRRHLGGRAQLAPALDGEGEHGAGAAHAGSSMSDISASKVSSTLAPSTSATWPKLISRCSPPAATTTAK